MKVETLIPMRARLDTIEARIEALEKYLTKTKEVSREK